MQTGVRKVDPSARRGFRSQASGLLRGRTFRKGTLEILTALASSLTVRRCSGIILDRDPEHFGQLRRVGAAH